MHHLTGGFSDRAAERVQPEHGDWNHAVQTTARSSLNWRELSRYRDMVTSGDEDEFFNTVGRLLRLLRLLPPDPGARFLVCTVRRSCPVVVLLLQPLT